MRKWYVIIFAVVFFVVLSAVKKRRKTQKDGIVKRIDTFVNFLFWFLLLAYSAAFVYWIFRALF
ncbi:MAG: hypothetical protein KAW12_20235 [Candidatus Aminicenantes bacterium]|nr:hypothetical protein [Candidatus Aminicenantes bacterium]